MFHHVVLTFMDSVIKEDRAARVESIFIPHSVPSVIATHSHSEDGVASDIFQLVRVELLFHSLEEIISGH